MTKPRRCCRARSIDLVDHAVDVEGQRVAPRAHRAMELRQPCSALRPRRGRRTPAGPWRAAHRARRCAWRACPSPARRPGRRRRSSAAAPRSTAGSSWRTAPAAVLRGLTKVFSPFSPLLFVEAPRSRRGACRPRRAPRAPARHAGQSQRHLAAGTCAAAHGADVLRHVLAGLAVAARGGLHQHAVLVAQVDRQAVELEFGGVLHRRVGVGQLELAPHAGIEGQAPDGSVSVSVRIDSIGTACRTGVKPSSTLPMTRWVGESASAVRGAPPRSPAVPGTGWSYSASGISGASST